MSHRRDGRAGCGKWLLIPGLLLSLGCSDDDAACGPPTSDRRPADGRIVDNPNRRHVIVMIGDGMQLAHEVATSRYLFGEDFGLSYHQLPESAFVTTS